MSNSNWAYDNHLHRDALRDPKADLRPVGQIKNTRRWCRGKIGVPHQLTVKTYREVKGPGWHPRGEAQILLCSVCGKELDQYRPEHPSTDWPSRMKPAWALQRSP